MSALVINNDFIHLANLLENYLQDKLPLGREFEDLVTKIRARLHNQDFPNRDTFISGLIDAKPFLVSRLEKLKSGRGASYYFGEIYDSLVTQTDINELIPSINDLGMHEHPRDLIKSMIAELSDVSYYKTELFGKVSFARGIFAEERENLMQSLRVVVDICTKELRKGGDIEPIIDTYFGEHSGYDKEQISKGALLEMSERFNCEDIGFTSFGIKTSLSENHDAMQRLNDSLDLLHNRFDGFESKVVKQENKLTFR